MFLERIIGGAATSIRPPEKLTISEWTEKYRYLNNPGSYVGNYNFDKVPYMREPADELNSLEFTGWAFVGPARTAKSDTFFNWMGYTADNDPADMLFYAMTQSRASEWAQRDFNKMVRAKKSSEKKSLMQRLLRPGKVNIFDKHFISGMQLMVRWPSITELSGKTVPRVWLEDYDRIPSVDDIEKQGNAFDLARKRTTTYKRFGMTAAEASPGFEVTEMNWIASSPHEAPPSQGILSVYNRGDRRRWYWRCPDCEEVFEPTFDLLTWPEEGDNFVRASKAELVCPHCGVSHPHSRKFDMNRKGRWLKEGETWNKDGSVTGTARRSDIASFWMQGPAAGFQTWEGLVLAYLNAMDEYRKTGALGSLKKTMNTDQGVPFVAPRDEMARLPETLKSRAEDWGGGRDYDTRKPTVPEWVRFLIATIDVQKRSFVVQITGIGEDGEMTVIDVFKIRHSERYDESHPSRPVLPIDPAAHAEDWNVLIEQVIEKTYPLADDSGRRMAIKMTGCDSGGRVGVTPNAVKFWLALQRDELDRKHHRRFHLLKGDTVKDSKWERMTSFFEANSNSTMNFFKGKVPFQRLNSNPLKDRLNVVLMRDEAGGARMRYPEWMPNWFYTQMCAEERIAGKGWSAPKGDRRNESFDLSYYCLGLCAHPDIKLDFLRWDDPASLPSWAKPWDQNSLVIAPEETSPLVERKTQVIDVTSALSAFG